MDIPSADHWLRYARSPALAWAVNGAMLILLGTSAASWLWTLATPAPDTALPATVPVPRDTAARDARLQALLDAAPFGLPVDPDAAGATLPMTSLNLLLLGLIADGASGLAVIAVNGEEEAPFRVGQEILPGVVLDAVNDSHVVIRRGAVRETLTLDSGDVPLAVSYEPPKASAPLARTNSVNLPRNRIREALSRPDLMTGARVVPVPGQGFRIEALHADNLLASAGLRSGDVVEAVNGEPLRSMEDAMRLYQQFGGVDGIKQITLDVRRGGTTQSLQVEIN